MVVNIRTARLLRPNVNLRDQLSHAVGWKNRSAHKHPSISEKENSSSSSSTKRLEMFSLFPTPWAADKIYEEKYEKLLKTIFELKMDHFTTTLMTLMALFNESEPDLLLNPAEVSNLQQHFTLLLHRYLCDEVGRFNASILLPQYKNALKSLQEMSKIFATKRLKM